MTNYKTQETMFIIRLNILYWKYHWIDVISFQLSLNDDKAMHCLHIKNKSSIDTSAIIIYAQDEQSNFRTSLPFLIDLASYLKMSIITFEYTNLKINQEVRTDIGNLYGYLVALQTIKRIILFGFSVGVYATLSLMQTTPLHKVEGIVMLSPNWTFDPDSQKKNKKSSFQLRKKKIASLFSTTNTPIMLIHGKKDDFIKYMLTYQISNQITSLMEWYPENGEHWDIHIAYRTKFYKKFAKFIKQIQGANKNQSILNGSNMELFTPNLFIKPENHSFKPTNNNNQGDFNDTSIDIEGKKTIDNISTTVYKPEHMQPFDEKDNYYQTFKEGDIIPTNASYKINEMNNDMVISSFKQNNNYGNTNGIDQGFSFTPKVFQPKGNFNISN